MPDDGRRSPPPGHNRPPSDGRVVRLPGVLVDLFPGAPRRLEVQAASVDEMVDAARRTVGRACATGSAIRRRRCAATSTSSSTASGRRLETPPVAGMRGFRADGYQRRLNCPWRDVISLQLTVIWRIVGG